MAIDGFEMDRAMPNALLPAAGRSGTRYPLNGLVFECTLCCLEVLRECMACISSLVCVAQHSPSKPQQALHA